MALTASPVVRSRISGCVVGGLVDDVAQTEGVEQARDQAAVVQDWAPVRRLGGPHALL